jgi:hypothetical protein
VQEEIAMNLSPLNEIVAVGLLIIFALPLALQAIIINRSDIEEIWYKAIWFTVAYVVLMAAPFILALFSKRHSSFGEGHFVYFLSVAFGLVMGSIGLANMDKHK